MADNYEILLRKAVKDSNSYKDVLRILGGDWTRCSCKYYILKHKIDCSHFTSKRHGDYEKYIGEEYGWLTIESIDKSSGRVKTNCICRCGKRKTVRFEELGKRRSSCGCHAKNRYQMMGPKNPAFTGKGLIGSAFFKNIKRSALRRGIDFTLSIEYIWDLYLKQDGLCALSGIPIRFGRHRQHYETTASLDRIDSSKSYVEGNVQWVFKDINMLKKDMEDKYLIFLSRKIADWSRGIYELDYDYNEDAQ